MSASGLFQHPSGHPAGHGITIGTPRFYDLSTGLFFGGRRKTYRMLMEAAGVRLGDHVLDVGCGPGYLARMLAQAVGPNGSVVGVDAAPEMVEYAAHKAARLPNCRFLAGSAESLALPDSSLDLVVSTLMMHHLPDDLRVQATSEMRRVLRPGGTLMLADFTVPERGFWHVIGILSGHAAGNMVKRVSPLEPLVESAGFVDIKSGDAPPWLHYVMAKSPS